MAELRFRAHSTLWCTTAALVLLAGCGGGEDPAIDLARDDSALKTTCNGRGSIGRACDDGDPCTFHDVCTSSGCQGTPYTCDDGDPCTADRCDGKGGCIHAAITGNVCDDGDPCTMNDVCTASGCKGAAYSCDDGIACTADACDGHGGCTHAPVASACDDGNACTVDSCDATAGCVHTPTANLCDDGNPCTSDSCDPVAGCLHTPVPNGTACDDRDSCTYGDVCSAGVCSGTRYVCDDGDPNTNDYCLGDGTCEYDPAICPGGFDCFFNPCGSGTICDGMCCVSSCTDGWLDSDESDVDCGGGCPQCANGKMCWGSYDCVSNNCVYATGATKGTCMP